MASCGKEPEATKGNLLVALPHSMKECGDEVREAVVLEPGKPMTFKTRIACGVPLRIGVAARIIGPSFHGGRFVVEIARGRKRSVIFERTLMFPDEAPMWRDLETKPPEICGEVDVTISASFVMGKPLESIKSLGQRGPSLLLASHLSAPVRPEKSMIVVLQDALRADRLGAWGSDRPTSPHIDRLARESTLFARAIAASSWTRSSVASLFTSRPPWDHGALDRDDILAVSLPTLAESLKGHGVQTAAFVGNGNVGFSEFRFYRGFSTWDVVQNEDPNSNPTGEAVVRAYTKILSRIEAPALFAYLHLVDPHAPYEPPDPFAGLWDARDAATVDGTMDQQCGFRAAQSPESIAHVRALYDEEVLYGDLCVGKLRAESRRGGLDPSIVFLADHGEAFGDQRDHWAFEHGTTVYEEELHVPLLVKTPPFRAGATVSRSVSLLDVAPTILQSFGIAPPAAFGGASLASREESPLLAVLKLDGRELVTREQAGKKQIIAFAPAGPLDELDVRADPGEQFPTRLRPGSYEQWLWSASRKRPGVAVWASELEANDLVWLEVLGPDGGTLAPDACVSGRVEQAPPRLRIRPSQASAFAFLKGDPKRVKLTVTRGGKVLYATELSSAALDGWESPAERPKVRIRYTKPKLTLGAPVLSSDEQKRLKALGYLQ